jgi:hypothetical protein
MKKAVALVLFLAAPAYAADPTPTATSTPAASSQPELQKNDIDMAKLEQALSTKRREIIAAGMGSLTADQMKTFWTIYGDFEKEKDAIMAARLSLLAKYTDGFATLTDADITKMVPEMFALQKQMLDLRAKYFDAINKKLGAKAAGRFVHIDDYITTIGRLAMLDNMPALQVNAPAATTPTK